MEMQDVKVGDRVAAMDTKEQGVVERIDYDDDVVYVRFPDVRGVRQVVDLDPGDLTPVEA